MSATASPDDHSFRADIGLTPQLSAVAATCGEQIRHVAGERDMREPAVILLFRRAGGMTLRVGGKLTPLDVAIVSSDTDFAIRAGDVHAPCSIGWISLTGTSALAARMRQPVVVPHTAAAPADDGASQADAGTVLRQVGGSVLAALAHGNPAPGADVAHLAAQLAGLIGEVLENCERTGRQATGEAGQAADGDRDDRDIIAAVQRYLRQHARDADLTPARLARHCAVSVRKLYNAFAEADLSLHGAVLSHRLEEARRQLSAPGAKKVTSIAFDSGFKDISTFYRNFRREFGYSPRGSVAPSPIQRRAAPDRGTARPAAEPAGRIGARRDEEGETVPLPREMLFRRRAPRRAVRCHPMPEGRRFTE
ncbi:AraC-like DNA-binding protein [Pseudochelatococcus lubricantis]|uniref:AraC-like DNA-binding protein n=1 Tax=Pseudochelatococcus lubricantis TaxID=1538102 RepID=A0ABX0V895_9HYPH|nr:AraC-like DNA-binding protein [Pseudochelatococcus lubricantis]